MGKVITLSDSMYSTLYKISKSLDIKLLDNNLKITNNQDESLIESKNDVLDIMTFLCAISGRNHNITHIEEIPAPKVRKKRTPKPESVVKEVVKKPTISLNLDVFTAKSKKKPKKIKNISK